MQCCEEAAYLPCPAVQKAANPVREHNGSKAVLQIEVAGRAMLHAALAPAVEERSHWEAAHSCLLRETEHMDLAPLAEPRLPV